MIKKILLSTTIISFSFFCLAEDKIVAKMDGREIHESEIKDKITVYAKLNNVGSQNEFNYDNLNKEMKEEIVKNMIYSELILKQAQENKVNESKEYKQALEFAGKQIIQKIFLEKLIKENITEDKLKNKYKEIVAAQSNQYEYKVRHILVKTEKEALEIKQKLDKGEDFAALAKQYSLDGTKDDGGQLGYFTNGQMVPAFEEAVAKLQKDQISAPIKTDFGYHIIQLQDKRKAKPASFEQMRDKIYEEMASQFVQDYLSQLFTQNKVEIF